MTASWPGGLPNFSVEGYEERPPALGLRTQMDIGPAKTRRRLTANATPYPLTIILTSAQVDTLENFHKTTLAGGTLPFTLNHPRTGASLTWKFVSDAKDAGLVVRPWQNSPVMYQASLSLELLP